MNASKGEGGLWLLAFGKQDRQRSSVDNYGYRNNALGTSVGLDVKVKPGLFVGAGVEINQGLLTIDEDGGDGRIRSYSLLGYGTYYHGPLHIDLSLAASLNYYHINRKINIMNMPTRIANSHHKGYSFTPHFRAGYKIPLPDFVFEPFAGIDYVFQNQQSYQESGAQSLNFNVQGRRSRFARIEGGVNAIKEFKQHSSKIELIGKLSYVYRQSWNSGDISATMVGQTEILNITGTSRKQHLISPGVEGNYVTADNFSLGLALNTEIGPNYSSKQATIKFTKRY